MARAIKAVGQIKMAAGRDEMNLAEFPISLLSNREPEDRTPLVFEGRHGRLTISGTDGPREKGNGLPTAQDTDVLIGLLQLTKRANDFTDPTVHFSRYELLRIIRWPDDTKSYRRLRASLKRWSKVSLDYENSWYDNQKKCRVDATFHILNSVVIYERSGKEGLGEKGNGDQPSSRFTWGTEFFKSCKENYLKRLDLDVYFSLESAASKQLYRFLDKELFRDIRTKTFELRVLAVGHVGLSVNYTIPRIKEKLAPCLEELERIGFIEPATKEQRYTKTGHGQWDITFTRKDREQRPLLEVVTEPETPLARELINRGVTPFTARELVRDYPAERIARKLEVFDWLMAKKDRKASKSPSGYLVSSIRGDYKEPQGFKSRATLKAERLEADKAQKEREALKAEADAKLTREKAADAAADEYLASLDSDTKAKLEREAYAASELNPRLFGKIIVRDHVRKLLGYAEK